MDETFLGSYWSSFPDSYVLNSTCFNWDSHMDLAHMLVTLLISIIRTDEAIKTKKLHKTTTYKTQNTV